MTAFFARPSSDGNARPHSVPDSEADEKKRSSESTNKSGKVFAMLAIKLTRHAKYGIIIWHCGDDDPQCEPTVQKYPSGSRGSPAKGVVRETVARVQIPPSAPYGNNTNSFSEFVLFFARDFFGAVIRLK